MSNNTFNVEIKNVLFGGNPSVAEKIIVKNFSNGERISPETRIECNKVMILHVKTDSNEYETVAFLTAEGVYYTSSEAVRQNITDICEEISDSVEIEGEIIAINLKFSERQSKSNATRRYMTCALTGVVYA